jgi:hypothetical protein
MSVAVEISDCRLVSDGYQWIIEKKWTKKKDGSVYFTPMTYHPSLKWAAKHLLENTLRNSDSDSLEEIIQILDRIEAAGVKVETVTKL